jgi:hypothetical protein
VKTKILVRERAFHRSSFSDYACDGFMEVDVYLKLVVR